MSSHKLKVVMVVVVVMRLLVARCARGAEVTEQDWDVHVRDTEQLSKTIGGRVCEALSILEKSSNKTESVRIAYLKQQVDEDVTQHKLIGKIAMMNNAVLRVQLIAINLGYDLLTPPYYETPLNRDEIMLAISLVKMYTDLVTVEVTDRILANASFVATERLLVRRTSINVLAELQNATLKRTTQRKLLDEWLSEIIAIIKREPKIRIEFDKKRREAEYETEVKPLVGCENYDDRKLKARVLESPLFRRTTLCKQFLKLAFQRSNSTQFLFARAVYQLARKPDTRVRVNEAFQKALVEIAVPETREDTYRMLREKLFLSVISKIAEDRELDALLQRTIYSLDVRFKYERMRDSFAPF